MARRRREAGGPSLEGFAGSITGFVLGYFAIEGALPGPNHPVHWVVALGAGAVGYLGGAAVSRLKARRVASVAFVGRSRAPRGSFATKTHRRRRRR